MVRDTGYKIFGMPIIVNDALPEGSIFMFNPAVLGEPITSALIKEIYKSLVRYGKRPDKLILTQSQMDLLTEEWKENVPGIINENPNQAPDPVFMGIPIEIK